jgi:hypothetical protein
MEKQMKKDTSLQIFDIMFDCLSSDNKEHKKQLEMYVLHRKTYGRQAAARIYPQCHNIVIQDPLLKDCWNNLLKTIDTL